MRTVRPAYRSGRYTTRSMPLVSGPLGISGRTCRVPTDSLSAPNTNGQLHRLQPARPGGEHAQSGDLRGRLPAARECGGHSQTQHQCKGAGPRRHRPRGRHMTKDRQALGQTCARRRRRVPPSPKHAAAVRQRLNGSMVPSRSAFDRPGRRSAGGATTARRSVFSTSASRARSTLNRSVSCPGRRISKWAICRRSARAGGRSKLCWNGVMPSNSDSPSRRTSAPGGFD